MQQIIIGIVSHGHYDYISTNAALVEINEIESVTVVIKDNVKDKRLKTYAKHNNFEYLVTDEILGFGENNNFIFDHAEKFFSATESDWFIILNPDVIISTVEFSKLMVELGSGKGEFFAPNLFKDREFNQTENSIRHFASYRDLFNPFRLKPINRPYDKEMLNDKAIIEWASGAFLCISFQKFKSVNGFSGNYFMYYEDVDLCYRLRKIDTRLVFLKNIKAVHRGEYKNRSVFSKHFLWYVSSLFKFLAIQRKS